MLPLESGMDLTSLDILACPLCKGRLAYQAKSEELVCQFDQLAFPVREGVPILWVEQARTLSQDEV